jgi:hypothetical protein
MFPKDLTFDVGATENFGWQEFFRPFASVKDLAIVSSQLARPIFSALAELAGQGIMEVLLMLQNFFVKLRGPFQEAMERFIATRQLSGHPVAVHEGSIKYRGFDTICNI